MTTIPDDLELIGPIVRLQVQTASLKRGEKPRRWFDPAPIRPVSALRLDAGGVTGLDDGDVADVHHRDHPQSKFRGENGVSVGFTGHYARVRARYGDRLTDGIAGENILVDAARTVAEADLEAGIVIVSGDGTLALDAILAAPPASSSASSARATRRTSDRTGTSPRPCNSSTRACAASTLPWPPTASRTLGSRSAISSTAASVRRVRRWPLPRHWRPAH